MDEEKSSYNALFSDFSAKIEAWLVKILCTLLTALIIVQMLHLVPAWRLFLSRVAKLEGTLINDFATVANVWYNLDRSQALPAFLLKCTYSMLLQ